MKRTSLVIPLLFSLVLVLTAVVGLCLVSGRGKCPLGESLYFPGTLHETCAPIGTKIDIIPRYLKVSRTVWSGWDGKTATDADQYLVVSRVGQEISLKGLADDFSLKVISFDDSQIKLQVPKGLYARQGNVEGRVDFSKCGGGVVTARSEEIFKLHTCTMDAGVTWQVAYNT